MYSILNHKVIYLSVRPFRINGNENYLCSKWACRLVVPKSYQREREPRKTENELTNNRWRRFKTNLNPNPNPNANTNPKPNPNTKLRKETKKKEQKEREPSGLDLPDSNTKTKSSACDNPTNCAKQQFVTKYLIFLAFIVQHVIDKKLVVSLPRLSLPLVRFGHNLPPVGPLFGSLYSQ